MGPVHLKPHARVAVALLTLLAIPSFAATISVLAEADGVAVTDAEACFWPGRNLDEFFDRFLASGDVHCHPITNIPQPPDGVWNYYVQSRSRVSTHPDAIQLRGPGSVRPLRVELLPAGTLDVSSAMSALRPGESLALYISNEHRDASPPAVRPIPVGRPRVLTPAEMPVLLLIISGEEIVWASRPLLVHAGEIVRAPTPDRTTHDVIVVVGLDRALSGEERATGKGTTSPSVTLVGKQTLRPVLALRGSPVFDTSIVEFLDVPAGEYAARVDGTYWLADEAPVNVPEQPRGISQPSRQLTTRPRAAVAIRWQAWRGLASARSATCMTVPSASTHLTVAHCVFGFGRTTECAVVHDEEIREESGERTIGQLPPGDYYVTLNHGEMIQRERSTLHSGQTANVTIALMPGHIRGRVTMAGKPVGAVVTFAEGGTRADENGEYDALVAGAPQNQPIRVTLCGSQREYIDLPPRPLLRDDTYDITIPENRLTIAVVDSVTGAPLVATSVTSRIITPEHTISSRFIGHTDLQGTITDDTISEHVTLEICAHKTAYESRCIRNITMQHDQETVRIALQPIAGRAVRISAMPPVGSGRVYAVTGSTITGEVPIEGDGVVRLVPGPPAAVLYIVARNYPLLRVPFPDLTVADPVLRLAPPAPVTRTVTLAADSPHHGGPIGLEIDGNPVPSAILDFAQALHNTSVPEIHNGETITLGPLDASLHPAILLWRFGTDLPADLRITDPFNDPRALRLMYRAPLIGDHVTLTPAR